MSTLGQLLLPPPDQLAARMTDALADEGVVIRSGGANMPIPGWRMMAGTIAKELEGLLDIGVLDILVNGWNKSYALGQQLEKSRSASGKDFLLQLAEHKITSKHEPYLALMKDGHELGRLPFTVSLEVVLQGAVLRIRDGEIQQIETGRIKGKGAVKCGRVILVDKELPQITVPGTLQVAPPAPPVNPPRLARAS